MPAKRNTLWGRAIRLALGVSALGAGYLFYTWLTLPDVRALESENPKSTAFMDLRVEEARAKGDTKFQVRQRWVPYSQISENLKKAVLKAEDASFFDHDGIDLNEIKASMERNWEEGKFTRGASTITQQLAKNLYLSPSRNPMRKVKELMITRRLEAALTKRRILEIYLNVIEWGDGIFGCEQAARTYFGKSAKDLTASEAALLAGAIINPREHSPAHPTRRLLRRQQIILRRMQPAPMPQPPNKIEPAPFPLPDPSQPVPELIPPSTTTTTAPDVPVPQPFPQPSTTTAPTTTTAPPMDSARRARSGPSL